MIDAALTHHGALQIFHELGGPIFPPRHMRNSFIVQSLLDKIEARRRREDSAGADPDRHD